MADGRDAPVGALPFRFLAQYPTPLKPWAGYGTFKTFFLVDIITCDRDHPVIDLYGPYRRSSSVRQSTVTMDLVDEIVGSANPARLTTFDLECNSTSRSLIIFRMGDGNAIFRNAVTSDGPAYGIVEEEGAIGRVLFSSVPVAGSGDRVFSVVLNGVPLGSNAQHVYGLVVTVNGQPDVIDPKVQNDGDGAVAMVAAQIRTN